MIVLNDANYFLISNKLVIIKCNHFILNAVTGTIGTSGKNEI